MFIKMKRESTLSHDNEVIMSKGTDLNSPPEGL